MPDESLTVRRKIGLEWGYDGRKYAADALTRRQNLGFRHRQRKAESENPGKLNGADGISDIGGKAARGAASEFQWSARGRCSRLRTSNFLVPTCSFCDRPPFATARQAIAI